MAMSATAYARQLKALLPPGAAWNLEPTSVLSLLFAGLSEELARLDARGGTLIHESDPRTALETLEAWERMLDLPDDCVVAEQSIDARRASIVAQLIALGGQTPAYYIAVAAALGVDVTITEFSEYDVADDCEEAVCDDAWAYAWQVNAAMTGPSGGEMTVEDAVDELISWWATNALECTLYRLKPAHTTLLFAYSL